MNTFILESEFSPKGDQQQAIDALTEGVNAGKQHQVLLGVTGSGKTVAMANVIAEFSTKILIEKSFQGNTLKFRELVRLLEQNGFKLMKEKGSIRYYAKRGIDRLIRIDYHGSKEVPTGTCQAIVKAAGLLRKGEGKDD